MLKSSSDSDKWDKEIDDELQPETDPYVIDSLGFDPLEFAEHDEEKPSASSTD